MFKDEGITVYKRLRQPLRQTEAENNLTLNTVFGLIISDPSLCWAVALCFRAVIPFLVLP